MRHPARLCIAVLALLGMLVSVAPTASAASYRTWIAQEPAAPAAGQSVAVWVDSDTAPGESAGLEYRVGGAYTKVLGSYDTSHPGGTNGPEDDPYNRAPYPWADESGNADIYGPADAGMIGWYSQLSTIRKAHPSLRGAGTFTSLLTGDTSASTTDNSTYAFSRTGGGETTVVLMNNGASANTVSVPAPAAYANGTVLIDGISGATTTVSGGQFTWNLAARSGAILWIKPASQAPVAQIGGASTASPAGRAAESFSATAVTLDLAGTDDRGIAKLKVTVDGLTTTVAKPDHQVRLSTAGRHTVTVVAIDTNGRSSAPVSAAITIDTTAPKTSAAMVSGKIKFTATDAGSGAAGTTYRINGGELLTYTGPVSAPKGATVTYSSIDRAGNGEAVRTFKVA